MKESIWSFIDFIIYLYKKKKRIISLIFLNIEIILIHFLYSDYYIPIYYSILLIENFINKNLSINNINNINLKESIWSLIGYNLKKKK